MNSAAWVVVTDALCLLGAAAALWAVRGDVRAALAEGPPAGPRARRAARLAGLAALAATASQATAVVLRGVEVNHFPSQTMSEVLTVFGLALLVSLLVLRAVLGLTRRGPGWAALDAGLVALVLGGVAATDLYVRTLSTAQRDLPPALQSDWFAPHLSALIFSYSTLAIAGLTCLAWFALRFWTGLLSGGRSRRSQLLVLAALVLIPFAQVVTIPVLLATGAVCLALRRGDRLPDPPTLRRLELDLDEVSFRMFAVGMPFLTAGLWMGAFWAQEAWANYWGWDSKENSALITWLVYVLYLHLRMLGGYRGEKAMALLLAGALSIFMTFQLFGYLPDSQRSLHRYTDDMVLPQEGMQAPALGDP